MLPEQVGASVVSCALAIQTFCAVYDHAEEIQRGHAPVIWGSCPHWGQAGVSQVLGQGQAGVRQGLGQGQAGSGRGQAGVKKGFCTGVMCRLFQVV